LARFLHRYLAAHATRGIRSPTMGTLSKIGDPLRGADCRSCLEGAARLRVFPCCSRCRCSSKRESCCLLGV